MAQGDNFYTYEQADGANHEKGGPLLFVFHGTGGNEKQFLNLGTKLMPTARVIAPRGDVSEGGALRFFRRNGEGNYDFEDLAKRTKTMVQHVKHHIEQNKPSIAVGLGYSNGANILASTIDAEPKLFNAAALMHPLVTWDMPLDRLLEHSSYLITAGQHDPICPPNMTHKLVEMLKKRGATVQTQWHQGGHEINDGELYALQQWFKQIV